MLTQHKSIIALRTLQKILHGFFLKMFTQLCCSLQEAGHSGGEEKEASVEGQGSTRTFTAIVVRTISVTAYRQYLFCLII
jgi:hypothetical protein